ncbi:MAG: multiheme c-type cytochrome [Fuerstiella sp.]
MKKPKSQLPMLGRVLLLSVIVGCSSEKKLQLAVPYELIEQQPAAARVSAWAPPHDVGDFVGTQACAECHQEISETYRSHSMSISAAPVAAALPEIEDYETNVSFTSSAGLEYRVSRDGDHVRHHEKMFDSNGGVLYDQAVEMQYAFGSGVHGRSYLHEKGGLLFMSPVTWYSGKQRWDLSPGYRPEQHPRFERRLSDDCIACHVGRVNPVPGSEHRFENPPFLENAIGCERCHGPGRQHIAFHSADADVQLASTDPIVNPASLRTALRESVCNQCHIQGVGRVLRADRRPFDFRPGMHMNEIWTTFVTGTGVDGEATEILSQVEQMRTSRCYIRSDGRLGCTSCHDPHSSPGEKRIDFYRAACMACHTVSQPGCSLSSAERLQVTADDSCIDCHMPRLPSNVPHTANTDHRVLRHPVSESTTSDARSSPVTVFDRDEGNATETELLRALGIARSRQADSSGNPVAAREALALLAQLPSGYENDLQVLDAAANACLVAHDYDYAQACWERVIAVQPEHESALRGLGVIAVRTGKQQAAVEYLGRLIQINGWDSDLFGQRARLLGDLGQMDAAIVDARRCLELNPGESSVHDWLDTAYRKQGDVDKAAYHAQQAERIRKVSQN